MRAVAKVVFDAATRSLMRWLPGIVAPRARYDSAPIEHIVVLQYKDNATTDTYLLPRLDAGTTPYRVANIATRPEDVWPDLREGKAFLIIVRYVSAPWLRFLEAHRDELAGVAYFVDDDMPAAIGDASLPMRYRAFLLRRYSRFVPRLSQLVSELWVSTPGLAETYREQAPIVVPQLYVPKPPTSEETVRLFYHGSHTHEGELRWLVDIVAAVQKARPNTLFEVFGGADVKRLYAGVERVLVHHGAPWKTYLAYAGSNATGQIGLAPQLDTPMNRGRSINKYFDITRMGAAGLYTDAPPNDAAIEHGVNGLLLPNDPDAWTRAILELVDDRPRRLALAEAALRRCEAMPRDPLPFQAGTALARPARER